MVLILRKGLLSLLVIISSIAAPLPAQAPNGWIQDGAWLFLGPLGNTMGCASVAAMNTNWIAPLDVTTIAPAENDLAPIDFDLAASTGWNGIGVEPAWMSFASAGFTGSDFIDLLGLNASLGLPGENQVAALVTYVTYLGDEPIVVDFCDASDDSVQIWVNRDRLQNVSACRGTDNFCAEIGRGVLLPGKNAIKALVWQADQGWGFRLRLQLPDGTLIRDDHPDFEFGFDPAGAVEVSATQVTREFNAALPACSVPGSLVVTLRGDGNGGGPVTLEEVIEGSVTVSGISDGGTVLSLPFEDVEPSPVGIFDDARDIGGACARGETEALADDSYLVTGGGYDIWGEGDEFQFAYKELTGDFSLTAEVTVPTWAPGSRWGKVGVMARQDVTRNSRYAMVQTHGEDLQDADRLAGRYTQGGSDNFEATIFGAGERRPWMRLERVGNLFVGSVSPDGATWETLGSMDWGPSAPSTVLVGPAVCAHSIAEGGCLGITARFNRVELIGGEGQQTGFPGGARIRWELSHAELNAGVSYEVSGDSLARFSGHDGERRTAGPEEAVLSPSPGDLGLFEHAADIGAPCFSGSTTFDGESYSVTGGGIDIWTGGDQFQYVYRRETGNFSMVALVAARNWVPGSRWGKVGVMARQDCTDRARYSMLQTHGEDLQDADRLAFRPTHGGDDNVELTTLADGEHRDWMRLDRTGNTFTGFLSDDGIVWEEMGSHDWGPNAPETVLLGLAVNAHSEPQGGCEPATIVFDQVTITKPAFSVNREVPECPEENGAALVTLRGEGDPGGALEIEETVTGHVVVSDITGGGVFTQFSPLVDSEPQGIFTGTMNVGEPCRPSSTAYDPDTETYRIMSSGSDIWTGGDEFQFAYVRATGDFDMIARVAGRYWEPGSRWGKAGIMARQNEDPRARYAMVQTHGEDLQDPDRLAGRTTQGGADNFELTSAAVTGQNEWQRLQRDANVFFGYVSPDGVNWELVDSMDWGASAPRTVLVGLALAANLTANGDCAEAVIDFDAVELIGGGGAPEPLGERGGTIRWTAERAALEAGLTYRVETPTALGGSAFLEGFADGVRITGPDRVDMASFQTANLGLFDVAHDIGRPCFNGDTVYDPGDDSYAITGGGVDIWTDGDQFQYAYSRVEGDFSMVAHVTTRDWVEGSRWGKVGVMARQSCSARSRYSMLQTHGEDLQDADRFAFRPTHEGSDNAEQTPLAGFEHRDWMRLDRVGNVFTGYVSLDGTDWQEVGTHDWGTDAPSEVFLGLAVNAHSEPQGGCLPTTIVFDHVEIVTDGTPGPTAFVRGDSNADGPLNITDGVFSLNFLFLGGTPPPCRAAADSDGDGALNITDGVYLLNFLFLGGPPPPAPYPVCDMPPVRGMECLEYPPCP